jgi:hypothetical protein
MLGVLMSYFVWIFIRLRVVKYDWYIVEWCIEYVVHARSKVVF